MKLKETFASGPRIRPPTRKAAMTIPTTPDFIRLLDSEDTGSTSC